MRKLLQLTDIVSPIRTEKLCWTFFPSLTCCDTSTAENSVGKLVDLLPQKYPP